MTLVEFLEAEYVSVIAGAFGGVATAWLTHRVINKRGTFSYFVNHSRVGLTVEDAIFGKVTALWNGNEIPNLYISSIEITNESMNDYENVILRTYTNDTRLLSEQTQVLDSPNTLEWTEKFKNQLHVLPGDQPSSNQVAIFNGQREHLISVMNRGQSVRLTFLNSASGPNPPTLWVAISRKGVKVKFRTPQPQVFGVPGPKASLAGVLIGIIVVVSLLQASLSTWVIGFVALLFGLFAQVPGAYAVRALQKISGAISG